MPGRSVAEKDKFIATRALLVCRAAPSELGLDRWELLPAKLHDNRRAHQADGWEVHARRPRR